MNRYFTIEHESESLYKEKGSKFFAYVAPVKTEQQIEEVLAKYRKQYYDARHHCYGWMLGLDEQRFRANDDGEPAHTAGDPILGQIKSADLTNILVVVIRYFGGTKLGASGLIRAYKTAAALAINENTPFEIFEVVSFQMSFPYELLSRVERMIQNFQIAVQERDFQFSCVIKGEIKKNLWVEFEAACGKLFQLQLLIES